MKKRVYAVVALVLGLAIGFGAAAYAAPATRTVAAGEMAKYEGQLVQNAAASAPLKGGALCGTTVLTHGGTIATFNTYTGSRYYRQADWSVHRTTDGTPVVVKRTLGNNTSYMPGSSGTVGINGTFGTIKLSTFSNVSTTVANGTYGWCVDRR